MPVYEYRCPKGHEFQLIRAMSKLDAPADCPTCGAEAGRVLSVPSKPIVKRSL